MKKYENFCASFANLNDIFSYEEPYNNVVLTGLVALYEICFEQSWKMMKELLEDNGVAEGRTGYGPPFPLEASSMEAKISQHPVKGRFYKFPDFTLSPHHHAQHAGHDSSDGNHRITGIQIIGNGIAVFEA